MHSAKWFVACLVLPLVLLACGCGGDEFGREMVSVKGKVTVKGQPLKPSEKNVFVVFEKVGERPQSLEVRPDGTFAGEVPAGENRIKLQVYPPLDAVANVKKEYIDGFALNATAESGKEINLEVGE